MFHGSIKVLAGCKWSVLWCFTQHSCIESLEWFDRVATSCWFTERASIFISSSPCWVTRNLFIWGFTHQDTWEKKKAKIRCNMSERVSSVQRCWTEGKVGLIQGAQGSTGPLDVRDYRFLLFQGPKWGSFRGPKPGSAPAHYKSHFKTVITHPVQSNLSREKNNWERAEALALSWTQVQHSTR